MIKSPDEMPPSQPDMQDMFYVDKNVNVSTLDDYVDMDDMAYFDMRMLFDSAHFEEVGGQRNLIKSVEGFKVVPYPFIGTLAPMPVSNPYDGVKLFDVEWTDDMSVISAKPNYEESLEWVENVFPKDRNVLLMCGAGGYACMTRSLLIYLGWDSYKLYNVGGAWGYNGDFAVDIVDESDVDETPAIEKMAIEGIEYIPVDFEKLHPLQ